MTITLKNKIDAFVKLGMFFNQFSSNTKLDELKDINDLYYNPFKEIINNTHLSNAWFTIDNILEAIAAIGNSLKHSSIEKWISDYSMLLSLTKDPLKKIGTILAGNIPLVGFHDFLCILITGNIFIGKLSSKDDKLLPFIAEILMAINGDFKNRILFIDDRLTNFDAIIATGSDNSARYFNYYFGKYPNIIRKNRNGIAILNAKETKDDFINLGKDIFTYFGLGCRNVSKLLVPSGYNFDSFYEGIESFKSIYTHNKYANNYDYNRSIYLMNQIEHYDNGFLLLKEDNRISSPIGVVHFEYYPSINDIDNYIKVNNEKIQCIVTNEIVNKRTVSFGKAQAPELWDYADGIDTINFLLNIPQ